MTLIYSQHKIKCVHSITAHYQSFRVVNFTIFTDKTYIKNCSYTSEPSPPPSNGYPWEKCLLSNFILMMN